MGKTRLEAFSDGVIAIAVSFWQPGIAATIYALVAAVWLVPDRRIERILANEET